MGSNREPKNSVLLSVCHWNIQSNTLLLVRAHTLFTIRLLSRMKSILSGVAWGGNNYVGGIEMTSSHLAHKRVRLFAISIIDLC